MPLSGDPQQPDVVVVLSTGSVWIVPGNFDNVNNFIEFIGGGGGGRGGKNINSGLGGGGGGYSRIQNFQTGGSSSIAYSIGDGGVGGTSDGRNGDDTIWDVGELDASAGGGKGADASGFGEGGTGIFNGGDGGGSQLGAGGGGGGGSGGVSGSGTNGFTGTSALGAQGGTGGPPSGGVGGPAGSPGGVQGGSGSVWIDTKTGEIAGSGGGGGGGEFNSSDPQVGGLGGLYGGGGGGGSGASNPVNRQDGGDGQQGVIVITYRSTIHQLNGDIIDDSKIKMTSFKQRLRSNLIDEDHTPGRLLRRVILGPTQAGNTIAIDEDQASGRLTHRMTLIANLIDADMLDAVPTFEFKLTSTVIDSDTGVAKIRAIKRFRGFLEDNDHTRAFFRLIRAFRPRVLDGGGMDNDGIITGFIKFVGAVMDVDKTAHIILDPLRDLAFFVNRDPTPFTGLLSENEQTHPDTLHGFRFRQIIPGEAEFELIPVRISTKPDFEIRIILSEEELFAAGLID